MILAIDPGILNCGWASDTGLGGTKNSLTGASLNSRICDVAYGLYNILAKTPPRVVVVEDTFGALVKPTTMLLGGLMAVFKESEFILVTPSKWLMDLFGKGHKGQYKQLTCKLVDQLGIKYKTQHHADAIALLHWYKTVHVPSKQKVKKKGSKCRHRNKSLRLTSKARASTGVKIA